MIYYLLFAFLFLIAMVDFKETNYSIKNKIFNFTLICFILFRGLRWDTGCDFPQFMTCFYESDWSNIFSYKRYGGMSDMLMEPGFVFINFCFRTVFQHYTIFLLILESFVIVSFAFVIKRCVPKRFHLIALTICLIYMEIFSVRQTLATAFLCYSYIYIIDKDLKKYLLMIFLAYMVHRSSLVMLPLYWICQRKFHFKLFVLIYLGVVVLRVGVANYLGMMYDVALLSNITGGLTDSYTLSDDEFTEYSIMSVVVSLSFLYMCGFLLSQTANDNQRNTIVNVFSYIYFVYIIINVLATIPGLDIFFRLSNNLNISYAIIIGNSVFYLWSCAKFRKVIIFAFFAFVFYRVYRLPCFDKENVYYKVAYQPYYSMFERLDGKIVRQEPWPFHNK